MKVNIYLDNAEEKINNLSLASAILNICDTGSNDLNPSVIARVMLLETEAREQLKYERLNMVCENRR